jgi:hypothetical protein
MSYGPHPEMIELPHDLPPLLAAVNDRASSLVIDSVGKYPQAWNGAWLVADSLLMQTEGTPAGYATGVDIAVMAAIQPNPAECARGINALHEAFGIDRRVGDTLAAQFVLRGAMYALEQIRRVTLHFAGQMRVPTPPVLQPGIYTRATFNTPEEVIDRRPALPLLKLLLDNEELHIEVSTTVMEQAEEVRRNSSAQQQAVVARGSH